MPAFPHPADNKHVAVASLFQLSFFVPPSDFSERSEEPSHTGPYGDGRLPILYFLFLFLLLTSCGQDYAYDRTYDLEDEAWAYEDTLTFSFTIEDTLAIYNLYLQVEHRTDYAYQNLYTQIHTTFPSGERLSEMLSLELADKTGYWLGDCSSDYCTLRVPIQQGAYFNQAGGYSLTLEQYMRVNPVEGIRSMRFMLEDTGQLRQ